MAEIRIGRVSHVWPKAEAVSLELTDGLKVGEKIRIRGHGHDVVMKVTSLQVDHKARFEVERGEPAAVHVPERVTEGDEVFRIQDERSLTKTNWEEPPERW